MADERVVALKGSVIGSDRKAAVMDLVAGAFDAFVKENGAEPEAVFFGQWGDTQHRWSWDIRGPFQTVPGGQQALTLLMCDRLAQGMLGDDDE